MSDVWVRVRAVAVPSEHGGWSLTLEPVVLGLIVAPSVAGVALGLAALVAFLVRTPAKLALVDRRRRRRLERTVSAERVVAVELVVLAGLVAVAALTATAPFWWPAAIAAPLVVVALWFDVRSRSRRLVPELAGTIGIGSIAAAIALAGGEATSIALGLWTVVAARAIAAIPYVRVQLRRAKGQAHRVAESDLAQAVAFGGIAAVGVAGFVPPVAVAAIAGLAAVHVVTVRRPAPRAPVLGAQQVVLGLTVVVVTGLGVLAP